MLLSYIGLIDATNLGPRCHLSLLRTVIQSAASSRVDVTCPGSFKLLNFNRHMLKVGLNVKLKEALLHFA